MCKENAVDISDLAICHAEQVMDVCCEPTKILKEYSGSSMAVGLKLLKDGGETPLFPPARREL